MGSNTINNESKIDRPVSFAGLPKVDGPDGYGASPSDLDVPPMRFILEKGDLKKFLCGDFKERGKQLPYGQRVLLERITDSFAANKYKAVAFLAHHEPTVDRVDAAQTSVVEYYQKGKWRKADPPERLVVKYCRFFGVPMPTSDNGQPSGLDVENNLDELWSNPQWSGNK